jgi:hypothetical protein
MQFSTHFSDPGLANIMGKNVTELNSNIFFVNLAIVNVCVILFKENLKRRHQIWGLFLDKTQIFQCSTKKDF